MQQNRNKKADGNLLSALVFLSDPAETHFGSVVPPSLIQYKLLVQFLYHKKKSLQLKVEGFVSLRDPAGTRTQDPYIKSVLLYQLSYRVISPF